jgi:hypothetical protein
MIELKQKVQRVNLLHFLFVYEMTTSAVRTIPFS